MSRTVRIGLVTASLLSSLVGLAAPPATAQDQVQKQLPPPDPLSTGTADVRPFPAAGEDQPRQVDPSLDQVAASDEQAAAAEKRGHQPPPALAAFTGVVAIGRTRYTYTMVGSNPEVRRARNVVVPVAIVPIRLEFHDGTVLDPTQQDSCLGGRVPLNVTLLSPLFQDFDYGEGPRQFLEQIRRLEFWQFTAPGKINPGYSVRLQPSVLPAQTLALTPASVTQQATCLATGAPETMGHVDIDDFGNFLESLVPQFPKLGVSASTFVLFLLPNVDFIEDGKPAAVAFHAYLDTPQGKVTFAAAQLGVSRPGNVVNIGALSHELAEWLDDPFIDNDTPPWGDVGQVTGGCSTILEVGDPLTGTFLPLIKMPNGISYQPQETAFVSWFFHQVPSLGFDGWYSSGGTFRSPAAPCH